MSAEYAGKEFRKSVKIFSKDIDQSLVTYCFFDSWSRTDADSDNVVDSSRYDEENDEECICDYDDHQLATESTRSDCVPLVSL